MNLEAKKRETEERLKILTRKMLQRLSIALAPVKASYTSESLLGEMIYFFYQWK